MCCVLWLWCLLSMGFFLVFSVFCVNLDLLMSFWWWVVFSVVDGKCDELFLCLLRRLVLMWIFVCLVMCLWCV